jgi:hypothetical protein
MAIFKILVSRYPRTSEFIPWRRANLRFGGYMHVPFVRYGE